MSELILHRGGMSITLEELEQIPKPKHTKTYVPVPHFQLANTLKTIGQDILRDYTLIGESYGIARQGNQLFAVLKFQQEHSEMALSVAFRNSYDRSMSIGLAFGATVFVCDNLALCGDVVVMKKHTKNVWDNLENLAITQLYKSQNNFHKIVEDAEILKGRPLTDDEAFKLIGLLYGHGIISPRQIPIIRDEWLKPSHSEFEPRNMWSMYNAFTEGLKSTPPINVMERHVNLHSTLMEISQ